MKKTMHTQNKIDYAVWRKNRDGSWSLFGPTRIMKLPGAVKVLRKDGTFEHRKIWSVSKEFAVDGENYCFGRPEERRFCLSCEGMHLRGEIRGVFGGVWVPGEKDCDCLGKLDKLKK